MDRFEEIRRQAAIAGRVTDQQSGEPIAGAQVTVATTVPAFADWLALKALSYGSAWDSLAVRPDRVPSGDGGRFCFRDLPDGTYTVTAEWVTQGARYGTVSASATVARDANGKITLAVADLALPPTQVSGKVVGKASSTDPEAPVAMAEVRLKGGGECTFTDGQGAYVLSAIEPGDCTVRVQASGFGAAESKVTVGGRGQAATANFSLT